MAEFPLDFDDDEDDDPGDAASRWEEALSEVEALMPRLLPILLPPDIPEDAVKAYLAGALYTAAMISAGADANGLRLSFPTIQAINLAEAAERLISWETMLPWMSDWPMSVGEAEALAARFRKLAELCEARIRRR